METNDRLESFGICKLARNLFDEFWEDSEILGKDYRGRELCKQQIRSIDSVCANMEEGYGRGFGKELPQHLKISRGEARESRGRYERRKHLLPAATIAKRLAALNQIIGGLNKTIKTIESKPVRARSDIRPSFREPVRPETRALAHRQIAPARISRPGFSRGGEDVLSPVTRHPSP